MEFAGQPRLSEACNLLAVPGFSCLDVDEDEGEVVIGIRPKSSPLPRRKSSVTDDDSEPEPPPCGCRRVSFADAKGLSLVQVKEFDTWDVPNLPGYDSLDGDSKDAEEYNLSTVTYFRPLSSVELFAKVLEQKVELETTELLPGTTMVKGVVRVLNISYSKSVYVRTTLDEWSTHFDLLAEYVPGSSDGVMDCFSFKLTLVPPFGEQGARVDFCLRYETPVGTFWSNNNNRNYVLLCHHRMKGEKDKPLKENVNKKSCLKTVNQNVSPLENDSSEQESSQGNISTDESSIEADVRRMKDESPVRSPEETTQELLVSSTQQSPKFVTATQRYRQVENKQNSSRRRRRKAARLARVRDYFAQRNGGASDSDRDESLLEIKQATQEGTPGEERADPHSYSLGNSKSECSQVVFEALETNSELPHDAAHDRTTSKDQEKSDPAASARAESATDIPNKLQSAEELTPAGQQNTSEFVRKSEESSRNQDMRDGCVDNTAAVSRESFVNQAGSFTFGTVVAPLYHEVFSKVGSERRSRGGEENPRDTGDFHPSFEQRQTGNIVPTALKMSSSKVQGNMMDDQDSNCPEITQNSTDAEQTPTETEQEINQNCTNTFIGPDPPLGDTLECPGAVNPLFDTNLLTSQRETQQDNLAQDFHRQTAEPPEETRAQIIANVDETPEQGEALAVFNPVHSVSDHPTEETDQQTSSTMEKDCKHAEVISDTSLTETAPSSSFRENKLSDKLEDFDSDEVDTERSVCGLDSFEPERKHLIKLQTCLESQNDTYSTEKGNEGRSVLHQNEAEEKTIHVEAELTANDVMSNDHSQSDIILQLKVDILEKIDHRDLQNAVPKEDKDFCSANNELKNWEMMVEEEENAILANNEEGEVINRSTNDTEALEKDAAESKTEESEEVTEKMDSTVELEGEDWMGGGEIEETEAVKDVESDDVEVIETEKIIGAKNTVEVETKEQPEETEQQDEKHFSDIQQVSTERPRVRDEERVEVEERKEIHHVGVEQERLRELREENKKKQISPDKEENTVVTKGQAEVVQDYFEKRSGITQSQVEDGLSALMSNGLEVEKENTKEEQHGNTKTGFPSDQDVPHDPSKSDKHPASEADVYISTDDPESELTCHDSASESDSDDEVELYMHCLRAVGASAQAHRIKDTGVTAGKRPSVSRGKLPSAPMPPISESLDEEQHTSSTEESPDKIKTETSAPPPLSSGQESSNHNFMWWKDTFSCSNISKTLLYTTLLVVFLVVAYHFDFLACFGLYVISVVWLCCQGEKQPGQSNKRAD